MLRSRWTTRKGRVMGRMSVVKRWVVVRGERKWVYERRMMMGRRDWSRPLRIRRPIGRTSMTKRWGSRRRRKRRRRRRRRGEMIVLIVRESVDV